MWQVSHCHALDLPVQPEPASLNIDGYAGTCATDGNNLVLSSFWAPRHECLFPDLACEPYLPTERVLAKRNTQNARVHISAKAQRLEQCQVVKNAPTGE